MVLKKIIISFCAVFICVFSCYAQENDYNLNNIIKTTQEVIKKQNVTVTQNDAEQQHAETQNNLQDNDAKSVFSKNIISGAIIADLEETGKAVIHLEFELGKARILPEHLPVIEEIYTSLITHADWKLRIEGHTDSSGKPAWNKKLSLKRALAIQDALIKKGIDKDRLKSVGFGSEKPVDLGNTPEAMQHNRRVELHLE